MFSYWRDKRTGLCHMSLRGTTWPATFYERISADEFDVWEAAGRKPFEHPLDISFTRQAQQEVNAILDKEAGETT